MNNLSWLYNQTFEVSACAIFDYVHNLVPSTPTRETMLGNTLYKCSYYNTMWSPFIQLNCGYYKFRPLLKFDLHMSIVFPTIAIISRPHTKKIVYQNIHLQWQCKIWTFSFTLNHSIQQLMGVMWFISLDKVVGNERNPHHMKINSQHL